MHGCHGRVDEIAWKVGNGGVSRVLYVSVAARRIFRKENLVEPRLELILRHALIQELSRAYVREVKFGKYTDLVEIAKDMITNPRVTLFGR